MTDRLPPPHRTLMCSWMLALALSVGIGGCDPSDRCDPDQVLVHGLCRPAPIDTSGIDAGTDDEDAGTVGDAAVDPHAGFGTACTVQSECEGFGLVCGEVALPYCTQANCMGNATACPANWICLPTGGAGPDPSVTSVCLKP